ncbi:MAG TPA: sugar-transfer associated ATP-grasp domain-containing protein, partial [Clostridia bacterium]|nr:sugar-transfer associated ATP-grasp domain-containing protein [Clostridia bacterium]
MGKIDYVLRRLARMDFRAMNKTAAMLHRKTGKSTLWLLQDMVRCAVKYNAGYVDYKIAEFYRLTPAQRETQITRGISNRIVGKMNDKADWHFFDNKNEFNTLFAAELGRSWIYLNHADTEALAAWLRDRGDIIAKPLDGSSGQGIEKFTPRTWKADVGAFEALLRSKNLLLLEECVVQHPALAALCPTSVNTLRIATLLGEKK